MQISMASEVVDKLKFLLNQEGADAVVRVRETKIGSACKSKIVLRLSIDEREDDDVEGQAQSLPFVINKELVEQYGENFSVVLDEHQSFDVKPLE
jgi:hypothetical protein